MPPSRVNHRHRGSTGPVAGQINVATRADAGPERALAAGDLSRMMGGLQGLRGEGR